MRFLNQRLLANFNAAANVSDIVVLETDPDGRSKSRDTTRGLGTCFRRVTVARRSAREIYNALSCIDPGVVFAVGWARLDSLVAIKWAIKHSRPVVVCSDSNSFDRSRRSFFEAVKKYVLSAADVGWAASATSAEYFRMLGMDNRRIHVGPLDAVDVEHFEQGVDSARANGNDLKRSMGLPNQYFLSVCRLAPEKNLQRLLMAYRDYRAERIGDVWDLVIVGEGDLRTELERSVQVYGLREAVHLPGWVGFEQLPSYYAFANAFVLASTREPWGVVTNEAAAAALPLLVSNRAGSATHLVRGGLNGFTFDPFDVAEIKAALVRISAPSTDRHAMGTVSREIAAAWGPKGFADSLQLVTRSALSGPLVGKAVRHRIFLSALIWLLAAVERTRQITIGSVVHDHK